MEVSHTHRILVGLVEITILIRQHVFQFLSWSGGDDMEEDENNEEHEVTKN